VAFLRLRISAATRRWEWTELLRSVIGSLARQGRLELMPTFMMQEDRGMRLKEKVAIVTGADAESDGHGVGAGREGLQLCWPPLGERDRDRRRPGPAALPW